LTPEEKSVWFSLLIPNNKRVPRHLDYDVFPSIALSFDNETNLRITQKDRVFYTDIFPAMAQYRFSIQDFERLTNDSGISPLYSHGGFNFWIIRGAKWRVIV
jgi:hypothetical protein